MSNAIPETLQGIDRGQLDHAAGGTLKAPSTPYWPYGHHQAPRPAYGWPYHPYPTYGYGGPRPGHYGGYGYGYGGYGGRPVYHGRPFNAR